MQNPLSVAMLASLCIVASMVLPCWSDPLPANTEITTRPTRPKMFKSPEQLMKYLEELGNFYAIEGRPRFGKRFAAPLFRPVSSFPALPPSPEVRSPSSFYDYVHYPAQNSVSRSDLYQLLFPYDE